MGPWGGGQVVESLEAFPHTLISLTPSLLHAPSHPHRIDRRIRDDPRCGSVENKVAPNGLLYHEALALCHTHAVPPQVFRFGELLQSPGVLLALHLGFGNFMSQN